MTDTVADTPLLVLPFRDIEPDFAKPPRHAGRMSAILGRVTMGAGAWVGDDTIIRADGHFVQIGDDFRTSAPARRCTLRTMSIRQKSATAWWSAAIR